MKKFLILVIALFVACSEPNQQNILTLFNGQQIPLKDAEKLLDTNSVVTDFDAIRSTNFESALYKAIKSKDYTLYISLPTDSLDKQLEDTLIGNGLTLLTFKKEMNKYEYRAYKVDSSLYTVEFLLIIPADQNTNGWPSRYLVTATSNDSSILTTSLSLSELKNRFFP